MQFTNCTTRKLLFHDPYESYGWTVAIYDSYQVVYIGHGWGYATITDFNHKCNLHSLSDNERTKYLELTIKMHQK